MIGNPTIYVKFENSFIMPDVINFNCNLNKIVLPDLLGNEGLNLPFMRTFLTNSVNIDYFRQKENIDNYPNTKYGVNIRKSGIIEEYSLDHNKNLIISPIPKECKRTLHTDYFTQIEVISYLLVDSKDEDDFLYRLERRLGISSQIFTIYDHNDLIKFINGEIPFEKVKSRKCKRKFKLIWLK